MPQKTQDLSLDRLITVVATWKKESAVVVALESYPKETDDLLLCTLYLRLQHGTLCPGGQQPARCRDWRDLKRRVSDPCNQLDGQSP